VRLYVLDIGIGVVRLAVDFEAGRTKHFRPGGHQVIGHVGGPSAR
jgi:hypothetical protein